MHLIFMTTDPSSFCTICTDSCKGELIGFLLSLSIHHPNSNVYVMCDSESKDEILSLSIQPNLCLHWFLTLDKYTGLDRGKMERQGIWSDFQMAKAHVIQKALQFEDDTLFLDCDIIVLDALNGIDHSKLLGVSPQFIQQNNVDQVGYYNGGMLWTRDKGRLTFDERPSESIFIGKFRKANEDWSSVLSEYHCTKGKTHKFTQREYLDKLRTSRFGLCPIGFGSKCHREVELMAFGTVPVITPDVSIQSYHDPPIEGVHYLRVDSPDEFSKIIPTISKETWETMSLACWEWYQRNVHSHGSWVTMMHNVLFE